MGLPFPSDQQEGAECESLAPLRDTFFGLLVLYVLLFVWTVRLLSEKAAVVAVSIILWLSLRALWGWRQAQGYRWCGDALWPTGGTGVPLRLVGVRRVALWWQLTARQRNGALRTIWVERWRLSPMADWRLAVLANGWQPLDPAPQEGVARLR